MKILLDIIIKKIPGTLFEPFMILSLIAGAYFLFAAWKTKRAIFLTVSVTLFFMYFWRIGIQIVSGRYAAMLIVPAIVLSVFLIAAVAEYFSWKKSKQLFFCFGIFALTIASIGKLCLFNRTADYIPYNCKKLQEDRLKYYDSAVYSIHMGSDNRRLEYYLKQKIIPLDAEKDTIVSPEIAVKFIREMKTTSYIFLKERGTGGRINAAALGLSEEKWQFISSRYRNNKHRSSLSVYRYSPEGYRSSH